MSIRLIEQAWRTDLEPMTKLVLLALADYANSDGKCWPGLNAISTKTGASYRTVQRQIEVLESQGHLLRTVTAGKGTTYTIHPCHSDTPVTVTPGSDDVTPLPDSHEAPDTVTPPPGHSDTLTVIEPESNHNEPSSPPTPQGKATGEWQSAESSLHVAKRAAAEIIKANPLLRPEYVANSLVPTAKAMNLLGRIAELEIKLEAIDAALANIETVAAEAAGAAPAQDQNNCS